MFIDRLSMPEGILASSFGVIRVLRSLTYVTFHILNIHIKKNIHSTSLKTQKICRTI